MINLLPPAIKQEVSFSKRNAVILRYTIMAAAIVIITVAALFAGQLYVAQKIKDTQAQLDQKDLEVAKYHKLETDAKAVNNRLTSIQNLQKNQAKFSQLLSDIAAATPVGVAIQSISLTGDDKRPVNISAHATSYKTAVSFRDALVKSPRISAADIVQVSSDSVTLSIAFKAGQSK
jgi:Tfp pilus assembly protein PilN